jgi:NSS family neurotransmitter:Na+ symporter
MEDQKQNRGSFGSNFGFLMAAIGSAVGLGNIWGFPYKMGKCGGFAFLLVYLCLAVFVGLCVMVGEMALGRKTGQGVVGCYKKLAAKFAWVGWAGIITGFCILCFYLVLGGMVTRYACGYLLAIFGVDTFGDPATFFGRFLVNGGSMVLWFFIFTIINVLIVSGGIQGGIEKFNKVAMPALFFILLAVLIYVACQPGAGNGYKFMFAANFSVFSDPEVGFLKVLKTAAGQMFFSLSLGMGCMITYGSYLEKKEDIQKNSVIVVCADTMMAILAGCVVLPACGAFGLDFGGGPGLLFSTMQIVFSKMGGFIGNLMGFLFYFLVLLAALSSSISILEVCTAYSVDKNIAAGKGGKDGGRKKATALFATGIFVFGLLVCLDALGGGRAGGAVLPTPAELFGIGVKGWNDCWLDFYDMISEGLLMPIGAMVMSLLIGWKWGTNMVLEECEACGKKAWGRGFFNACFKFITPIGMLVVLYGQITSFFG